MSLEVLRSIMVGRECESMCICGKFGDDIIDKKLLCPMIMNTRIRNKAILHTNKFDIPE